MQDLETIRRVNAESAAREIPSLVAAGKHVVVTYAGLHYLHHQAYDTEAAAKAAAQAAGIAAGPSERVELHHPHAEKATA
jgi:hypothetical protein